MTFPLLPRVTYWWHAESESAVKAVGEEHAADLAKNGCDQIDATTYRALMRPLPINRQD